LSSLVAVQGLIFLKNDFMDKDQKQEESYPKPSTADQQFNNQNEFIDQQPNAFNDKSVSDLPAGNAQNEANNPREERN
jgi:hypothetical protein